MSALRQAPHADWLDYVSYADAALAKLALIADLIFEADLTRTAITSAGLASLLPLKKLESLNLTASAEPAAAP